MQKILKYAEEKMAFNWENEFDFDKLESCFQITAHNKDHYYYRGEQFFFIIGKLEGSSDIFYFMPDQNSRTGIAILKIAPIIYLCEMVDLPLAEVVKLFDTDE